MQNYQTNNIKIAFITLFLLLFTATFAQEKYTVSGYIKEANSQELLIGASVYVHDLEVGTVANTYGFYSLSLPKGIYKISYSFVGYKSESINITLDEDKTQNVNLLLGEELEEIVVAADKIGRESNKVRTSVINLPMKQVKDIPMLLGEKDMLKVIQLMPGVQKGTEGQSGMYVRGGGPDQNLLILDDAPVYNAQHLFGFFSVFNGDALRNVELIKGGFPAKYGGRLSSVINMNMKDGNKEHYTGEYGVGLISSRGVIEGPILKDKASFLVSARRTYFDVLSKPFMKAFSDDDETFGYYFYDLNAKLNYDVNNKNKLYLSGYFGRDKAYSKNDDFNSNLIWGNQTATLRWNHQFNNKLFANTSLIFSRYRFETGYEEEYQSEWYELNYKSGIDDWGGKIDFNFYPNPQHTIQFGAASTYHIFMPRAIVVKSNTPENDNTNNKQTISSVENGFYIEDYYKPFNRLQIMAGLRYSLYAISDKHYSMLEPRFSSSFKTSSTSAIKASYALTSQYIHLLSNTGIGLPTDLWVPSTKEVKPQTAWQMAGGYAKDFIDRNISVTVEAYYKEMLDIVGFKEGANFLSGDNFGETENADDINWEQMIARGNAKSYGMEILIQRKAGKLSGWIGYTLSWTKHKFPELNFGKEFWSKYDRRHDISIVANYSLNKNTQIGATWVFASGNAFTLGTAKYDGKIHNPFDNTNSKIYKTLDYHHGRNTFRMLPYHRLDLGVKFSKQKKNGIRTWNISVYNAYSRQNPFFYYVDDSSTNDVVIRQQSLFLIIPSVSYSFKFN
ncbi:MAG: TonB-dependent receptor [Bacteroidia bacterium]|nr:MAG: TonB-dependent receptor [Bacteroidia bacterium]